MLINEAVLKAELGGIQASLNWKTVEPFARIANRNFRKQIGVELYNELIKPNTNLTELKEIAVGVVAWQSYDLAFPHLKIKVGDLGLMKSSPQNTVAITKWEYVDSREANLQVVDKLLEDFFELLEMEAPEVWKNSDAYKTRNRLFLRSASELGKKLTLVGRNSRFFDVLTTYIERAENNYIKPLLTPTLFRSLKQKWQEAETLTAQESELIQGIQWALAYLSMYEAYPYLPMIVDMNGMREARYKDGTREEETADAKLKNVQRQALWNDGQKFLGDIREFLDAESSPTVFAEYYQKNQINTLSEDLDFTDKLHVIL